MISAQYDFDDLYSNVLTVFTTTLLLRNISVFTVKKGIEYVFSLSLCPALCPCVNRIVLSDFQDVIECLVFIDLSKKYSV